jgi:hypothetical protein
MSGRTSSELAFLCRALKTPRITSCADTLAKRALEENWDHLGYLSQCSAKKPPPGSCTAANTASKVHSSLR